MRAFRLGMLLSAGALGGCIVVNVELERTALRVELAVNQAKWFAAGVNSYEYVFVNACNCPDEITQPVLITVVNGEVTALHRPSDGAALTPHPQGVYPTIAELFDEVEVALDTADDLAVQYDDVLGYPTQIYVDWSAGTADEETSYQASELQRIQSP